MNKDRIDELPHVPICECADCKAAIEIALRHFQEVTARHCQMAYIGVVSAHIALVRVLADRAPLDAGTAFATVQVLFEKDGTLEGALVARMQDIVSAKRATKQ